MKKKGIKQTSDAGNGNLWRLLEDYKSIKELRKEKEVLEKQL